MGSHSSDSVGGLYFRSSGSLKSPPPSPSPSSSLDSFPGVTHSHPNFHAPAPSSADLDKNERYQEHKEQLDRTLAEVRQQIRDLLRLIGVRDQVLAASRRAHQLLNKQCKGAISSILRKLVDREREGTGRRDSGRTRFVHHIPLTDCLSVTVMPCTSSSGGAHYCGGQARQGCRESEQRGGRAGVHRELQGAFLNSFAPSDATFVLCAGTCLHLCKVLFSDILFRKFINCAAVGGW